MTQLTLRLSNAVLIWSTIAECILERNSAKETALSWPWCLGAANVCLMLANEAVNENKKNYFISFRFFFCKDAIKLSQSTFFCLALFFLEGKRSFLSCFAPFFRPVFWMGCVWRSVTNLGNNKHIFKRL